MGMLKEKLKDAFDYAQFTAALGVFSVAGIETLQNTLECFGATPSGHLSDNPLYVSLLAAGTGVSVGNSYLQDFSFYNCIPYYTYSAMFGFLAGITSIATDSAAASPYIAAFVAAGAGMGLRRNLSLNDGSDHKRGRYDDFDY